MTMKTIRNLPKKQGGWALLEMNASSLVYGILIVAGLTLAAVVIGNAAGDQLSSGHRTIVQNVRDNYFNTSTTSGLNNTVAVTLEVAPPNWMSGTATIVNNLNGAVTVATATITATGDAFSVAEAGLNADQCRDFVNDIFQEAHTMTVGSTTVKSAGDTVVNPATVGTACNNATNTVTPVYTRMAS